MEQVPAALLRSERAGRRSGESGLIVGVGVHAKERSPSVKGRDAGWRKGANGSLT